MNQRQLELWKKRGGALPKVIGIHGPLPVDRTPLDPCCLEFVTRAKRRQSCGGCMFERQMAAVCDLAGHEASRRGLPDCQDGYIYLLAPPRDPRQQQIL